MEVVKVSVSLVCAYQRFYPDEQMKINTSYPSEERVVGFPVYLSIEGEQSGAYALFCCENWETLSVQQQLKSLENNVMKLYLSLPFKEIENDEE
jgi:hypothetical protein